MSQQSDKWLLVCTRLDQGLLDQLGRMRAETSGTLGCFFSSVCISLSPYPLFHPLVLILWVNPALGLSLFHSCSLFKALPLDLSLFPPHSSPKQGQTCNPFMAPLSKDSSQIILKDLQPRLGTIKGNGRMKKKRRMHRGQQTRTMESERVDDRGNRRRNLCHSDLSLCHAGGAQGVHWAWAERQTGARVNLKED